MSIKEREDFWGFCQTKCQDSRTMDVRNRRVRGRESSPDRVVKACMQMQPKVVKVKMKPIRKVKVVYYLTRNGHLEHPHYMEVTHLVNQPLRLRGLQLSSD